MKRLWIVLAAASLYAQQPMHLTLAEAQHLAIQNNPAFSASRYEAAAAHQVPLEYRANYAPTLGGTFTSVGADNGTRLGAGALNNPVVYSRLGSGLTVNQLVTDFGRTSNLVGMARLRAQAQDQVTEATRADILLATSQAYFQVLKTQSLLKVAAQTVAARQTVADQVSALAQNNLKSTLDVSFAEVNLSEAKLLEVQSQNDVQSAEAVLAADMGIPSPPAGFVLRDEPMPAELPGDVAPLIVQAIDQRPELRDLRLEASAAQRFARAEHDLFFPTLGVIGTAGLVPTNADSIPPRYGAIGLNVTIPIFNGGLFRARQTEAEMHARAAELNVGDLANRVMRDVRVAWLNAMTARQRITIAQQLEDQARLALDLAQSRYDLGLSSIVELSQAQLNLTSAQIGNTSARYDYQAARAAVEYQIGSLR